LPVITPGLFPSVLPGVSVGSRSPKTSPGQIARPGPVRAGLTRLRPTFRLTESREASFVLSALAASWESVGRAAALQPHAWASLGIGAVTLCFSPWESGSNPLVVSTYGIRGRINNRSSGEIGSPGPITGGLSRLRPQFRPFEARESPIPIMVSITSPWASGAPILQTAGGIWESTSSQIAAARALATIWEAILKRVVTVTAPWETTSLVPPFTKFYTSVRPGIAVRPLIIGRSEGQIGHPGPAPAGFSRFRETFPLRQQPRQGLPIPVAALITAPWESTRPALQTTEMAYEVVAGLTAARALFWASSGTIQSPRLALWESRSLLLRTTLSIWESLIPISIAGSASPWEGLRRLMRQLGPPWESLTAQGTAAQVRLTFWEAQARAVQTIVAPWESIQSLAKALQASFWSSEAGRAATALGRWEAVGLVTGGQLTFWAALQGIAQTRGAPYESATAAIPTSKILLTPWEALFGGRQLVVSPWEAAQRQASIVSIPWETIVALRVLAPGLWESIFSLRQQSQLALWEALVGTRATDLAPWEAHGPLVQFIDLVNLLGRAPTIAELEAWVSTIVKLRGHSG
jgi:hypothetical protein